MEVVDSSSSPSTHPQQTGDPQQTTVQNVIPQQQFQPHVQKPFQPQFFQQQQLQGQLQSVPPQQLVQQLQQQQQLQQLQLQQQQLQQLQLQQLHQIQQQQLQQQPPSAQQPLSPAQQQPLPPAQQQQQPQPDIKQQLQQQIQEQQQQLHQLQQQDQAEASDGDSEVVKQGRLTIKLPLHGADKSSPSKPAKEGAVAEPKRKSSSSAPTYLDMIRQCLVQLNDKKGSSLAAIKKFVSTTYPKVNNSGFNGRLLKAVKAAVQKQELIKAGARYKLNMKLIKQRERKRQQKALAAERKKKGSSTKETKAAPPKVIMKPPPPTLHLMAAVEASVFADILAVAEFFKRFSVQLRVSPFTAEMLYKALSHSEMTPLLMETHFNLMYHKLNSTESADRAIYRGCWYKVLNGVTWAELLRRHLLRSLKILGERMAYKPALDHALKHLDSAPYISLPLESKVRVLRLLVDDVTELEVVYDALDKDTSEKQELSRTKFHAEAKDREELRLLTGYDGSKKKKKKKAPSNTEKDSTNNGDDAQENGNDDSQENDDDSQDANDASSESGDSDTESEADAAGSQEDTSSQKSDANEEPEAKKDDDDDDDKTQKDTPSGKTQKDKATGGASDKMSSEASSNKSTKKVVAPPLTEEELEKKRKIEELTQANRLKKQKREHEFERQSQKLRTRTMSIGADKLHRQYWMFASDRTRLYVTCESRTDVEEMKKEKNWYYYDCKEEVEALLQSLDENNSTERNLIKNINIFKEVITKRMKEFTPETEARMAAAKARKEAAEKAKLLKQEEETAKAEPGSGEDVKMEVDDAQAETTSKALAEKLETEEVRRGRPKRSSAIAASMLIKDQSSRPVASAASAKDEDNGDADDEPASEEEEAEEDEKPFVKRPRTYDPMDPEAFTKYENVYREVDSVPKRPVTLEDQASDMLREVNSANLDVPSLLNWVLCEMRDVGLLLIQNGGAVKGSFADWQEAVQELIKKHRDVGVFDKEIAREIGVYLLSVEQGAVVLSREYKPNQGEKGSAEDGGGEDDKKPAADGADDKGDTGDDVQDAHDDEAPHEKEWRRENCENDEINDNILGLKVTTRVRRELLEGEIVRFYPSDGADSEENPDFDMWVVELDNGDEIFLDEAGTRKGLVMFLNSNDDTSGGESEDESDDDEHALGVEEPIETASTQRNCIWRNKLARFAWLGTVNNMETLSAVAFAVYTLSLRVVEYFGKLEAKARLAEQERKRKGKGSKNAKLKGRQNGRVVWVKMKGHPYWPAVEMESGQRQSRARSKHQNVMFLVTNEVAQVAVKDVSTFTLRDTIAGPRQVIKDDPSSGNNISAVKKNLRMAFRIGKVRMANRK